MANSPFEQGQALGLVKFGQKCFMDDLVHRGIVYLNPLSHFIKLESDELRADPHEGADHCWQPDNVTIKWGEKEITGIIGGITYRSTEATRQNVYCMYTLRNSKALELIDPRNFRFGDTYVWFRNKEEFLRRLRTAAEANGLSIRCGAVNYVDRSRHNGEMGALRKFNIFEYQNEFRAVVSPGTGQPLILEVGALSDIAIVGELATLNEHLKTRLQAEAAFAAKDASH